MSTLVVKFILFGYCFSIRKQSSQVQVLWEDHRNDLWVNSFGALFLAVHGSLLYQCHHRCPYVLWRQQASLVFVSHFWRFFLSFRAQLKQSDLDPMGGIIVCIYVYPSSKFTLLTPRQIASGIIIAWGKTIYRQFELLAGKAAPHDFLQLLIYKAATFNDDIIKIDTVRAYHSGPVRSNFFSCLRF